MIIQWISPGVKQSLAMYRLHFVHGLRKELMLLEREQVQSDVETNSVGVDLHHKNCHSLQIICKGFRRTVVV